MASPFQFFRKYSGGMMIVMVILSMLLFTLDGLFSDTSANLWLLGLLLGGTVFAIAGIGQGRWLQWGIGGAILGTVLGYILPGFVGGGGLSTSLGVIDDEVIYDLELRRAIANQMMFQATEETFGEGTGRFATLFGFGHQSNREDVIFGKLLRAEADRVGITVTDRMVGDYLKRVTNEQLTSETYVEIRNNLSYNNRAVSDDLLNEILSEEIKARMAFQMLRPRTTSLPPSPESYWEYFQRLNVRQQVNIATLDVDAFLDQIPDPSDSEVSELFATYAKRFPNELEPGSPGFRLPFRAKLAYVELDSEQVEKELGEITDEEIQKYYDENKETPLIRTPVLPDMPAPDTTDEQPVFDEATPTTEDKPVVEGKEEPPSKKTEAPSKPVEETKTEQEPSEESESKSAAADDSDDAAPEGNEAEAATDDEEDDSCGAFDEKTGESDDQETEAAEPESSDTEPVKTDSERSETDKADVARPDAAAETTEASDAAAPASPPPLIVPAAPADAEMEAAVDEIEYEYRELNDELKSEIRDEIQRQKVSEAIEAKMAAVVAQMESLSRERSKERFTRLEAAPNKYSGESDRQQEALAELRESMAEFNAQLASDLKAFANKSGLAYVETPIISYADLIESEDYAIGLATEPSVNPMMAGQSANVAMTVFQSFSNDEQNNDAQLFLPRRAQLRAASLDGASSHYAYWAVDFSISHIPTLDEPGVREAIVTAWKRVKARELVIARGEELSKATKDGLDQEGEDRTDMAGTLKDETVTGKDDAAKIAVRKSLPFSWMRTSSASQMNFQRQQATLSPISFDDSIGGQLEKAGDDFMKVVFEDMSDEDVQVVPNGDRSKYWVVHVTNRFPTPEIGMDQLRERFATEGEQFAFAQSPILGAMQQDLASPASIAWEKSVWRRYGVDPDAEPDTE